MLETKEKIKTATWSLAEQGIVSLGSFVLNIQLARSLPASEYGVFALVFSYVFLFQHCAVSLLFFPMCQRIAACPSAPEAPLVSVTMALCAAVNLVASLLLAGVLVLAGRSDLAAAALIFSLFWQMQDVLRRCLVAASRYRAAITGNAVTYVGQTAAVAVLMHNGMVTLVETLSWLAMTSAAGCLINLWHLRLPAPVFEGVPGLLRTYWRTGLWGMLGGLLMVLRVQIFPWSLGLLHGTAATAALQAVLNIGNLTNPLLFALCNTISLKGMQARSAHGNLPAWQSSRFYMLIGAPFIIAYCALVFAAPTPVLSLFYGSQSPFLADTLVVRIIMLSIALNYVADTTSAYLYGVDGGRMSTHIAFIGLAGAAVASVLVWPWALSGAAVAMLTANLLRLAGSYHYVGATLATTTPLELPHSDAREARRDA